MADDDELAELLEGAPEPPSAATIPFTEWSPEVQYLAETVDRLNTLISVVSSALGSRVDLPHADRPVSAAERLRQRRGDELIASLEADIADAYQAWADEHGEEV